MKGVKGCFVCGQDHRANTRHSREEVSESIEKLKAKHPQALLTVEDLAYIVDLVSSPDEEESEDDMTQWVDENNGGFEEDVHV